MQGGKGNKGRQVMCIPCEFCPSGAMTQQSDVAWQPHGLGISGASIRGLEETGPLHEPRLGTHHTAGSLHTKPKGLSIQCGCVCRSERRRCSEQSCRRGNNEEELHPYCKSNNAHIQWPTNVHFTPGECSDFQGGETSAVRSVPYTPWTDDLPHLTASSLGTIIGELVGF
jgi:hypothetical protein